MTRGGLLQQPAKRVPESAWDGEITDHLGHEKCDPAGVGQRDSRNGVRANARLRGGMPARVPDSARKDRPASCAACG
ncbi:hypothetical protein [Streptomyces sp. NBC_01340]|uniref:hypothetical protein n=1 Tax=Streptomyces sp. NBC_01340 TaxID=2903830 RepID=UPI003DA42AA1